MRFNSEAYKKAFPKAEVKPVPAAPEKAAEEYDETVTESVDKVAEEKPLGEDPEDSEDLPGADEDSEEGAGDNG